MILLKKNGIVLIIIGLVFFSHFYSCIENNSSQHFENKNIEFDSLTSDSIYYFLKSINNFQFIASLIENKLYLIKEPILLSEIDSASTRTQESGYLENFIINDSTLLVSDMKYIGEQIKWFSNFFWGGNSGQDIVNEKDVDSLFKQHENIVVAKASVPIFNVTKDQAYMKVVVRTSSSINANLLKFRKKDNNWKVVTQIAF